MFARNVLWALSLLSLVVLPLVIPRVVAADEPQAKTTVADAGTAAAALERLKGLAGTWVGKTAGEEGEEVSTQFRVTAAGSTVIETIFPGTDHEMISMYHLSGDRLVMTHYCAAGNQPHFQAKLGGQSDRIVFEFAGGTNFDPAKDMHIHNGMIRFLEDGQIESVWTFYMDGKKAGQHGATMKRTSAK
jgi:hypothetical protein